MFWGPMANSTLASAFFFLLEPMSGFFQVDEKVTLNHAKLDFLVHQREFFVVYRVVFGVSFCFFCVLELECLFGFFCWLFFSPFFFLTWRAGIPSLRKYILE